jgi:hypothetical protein
MPQSDIVRNTWGWVTQDRHRATAKHWCEKTLSAFTAHPHETDETYLQHLYFTVRMSLRFLLVGTIIFIHGLFPFVLVRTASYEIEKIYKIMKSRIPKSRRDATCIDYEI